MQRFCGDAKIPRVINLDRLKIATIATIFNNEFIIAIECIRIMEATPIFVLPSQFLVWIGKKILAQSDLDLVVMEYYKDRRESQLKNRRKSMNDNNLTELTTSTVSTY